MLAEYALIPDIFDTASHASAEECDKHLRELKECLVSRGLVRNLYGGSWWKWAEKHRERWPMRGRELLKKLKQQGRLSEAPACLSEAPEEATAWCAEALASHAQSPLGGILADEATANGCAPHPLIAPISKMTEQTWWLGGKNSIQLTRTTAGYLEALGPTLRHSSSLLFIDPHLDPERLNYASFDKLLYACGTRSPAPRIQIHRVCYTGTGKDRRLPENGEWERRFRSTLGQAVKQADLHAEVFLWDDFHDRYLISNLIGILMPNGFDTEESHPSVTRWARLDREHRDEAEREFDPAARKHQLRHRFTL